MTLSGVAEDSSLPGCYVVSCVPDECRLSDQEVSLITEKMCVLENGYSRPNRENEIMLAGRRYFNTRATKS